MDITRIDTLIQKLRKDGPARRPETVRPAGKRTTTLIERFNRSAREISRREDSVSVPTFREGNRGHSTQWLSRSYMLSKSLDSEILFGIGSTPGHLVRNRLRSRLEGEVRKSQGTAKQLRQVEEKHAQEIEEMRQEQSRTEREIRDLTEKCRTLEQMRLSKVSEVLELSKELEKSTTIGKDLESRQNEDIRNLVQTNNLLMRDQLDIRKELTRFREQISGLAKRSEPVPTNEPKAVPETAKVIYTEITKTKESVSAPGGAFPLKAMGVESSTLPQKPKGPFDRLADWLDDPVITITILKRPDIPEETRAGF